MDSSFQSISVLPCKLSAIHLTFYTLASQTFTRKTDRSLPDFGSNVSILMSPDLPRFTCGGLARKTKPSKLPVSNKVHRHHNLHANLTHGPGFPDLAQEPSSKALNKVWQLILTQLFSHISSKEWLKEVAKWCESKDHADRKKHTAERHQVDIVFNYVHN